MTQNDCKVNPADKLFYCTNNVAANTVRRYIMAIILRHLYNLIYQIICVFTCGRPMNAPTGCYAFIIKK